MANKQADEVIVDVTEVYSKSEQFFENNKKTITGIVTIAVLAFVGYFAYQMFVVKPKQIEAANELFPVQVAFQNDSLNAVIEEGERVAEDYSSVGAGKLASYYTAIAFRDNGQYEEALEQFKKVDFNDAAVGVLALGNVGDMHIELDNIEEGAKWLVKAAKKAENSMGEDILAPVYYHKAADAYLYLEDFNKAKSFYKTIIDDYDGYSKLLKVKQQYYSLIKK